MSLEVRDLLLLLALTCAGEAGALQRCAADFSQARQKCFSTFPPAAAILGFTHPGLHAAVGCLCAVLQWGKIGQVENLLLHQPGRRD